MAEASSIARTAHVVAAALVSRRAAELPAPVEGANNDGSRNLKTLVDNAVENVETAGEVHNEGDAAKLGEAVASVQTLARSVSARRKKRRAQSWPERRKRRVERASAARSRQLAESIACDAAADAWRARRLAAEAALIREETLQNDAGETLAEIHAKIEDLAVWSDILDTLERLRALRQERARKQADFVDECAEDFGSALRHMRAVLRTQADVYAGECRVVEAMLASTADDPPFVSTVPASAPSVTPAARSLYRDTLCLSPNLSEGMAAYYAQAYDSVLGLIAVRRAWDAQLTAPGRGSNVPARLVPPPAPSSAEWAVYAVAEPIT